MKLTAVNISIKIIYIFGNKISLFQNTQIYTFHAHQSMLRRYGFVTVSVKQVVIAVMDEIT